MHLEDKEIPETKSHVQEDSLSKGGIQCYNLCLSGFSSTCYSVSLGAGFSVLHFLALPPQDDLHLSSLFSELSTVIYVIIKLGMSWSNYVSLLEPSSRKQSRNSPVPTVATSQPGTLIWVNQHFQPFSPLPPTGTWNIIFNLRASILTSPA